MKNKLLLTIIALIAITFKTQSQTTGTFTDPRDGRGYKTVTIGTQTWMAENFAYKPSTGNFWAWGDDQNNVIKFGYLYDFATTIAVCPDGWHLPTDAEWDILINSLGGNNSAGTKLKSVTDWMSIASTPTNESGFTAIPAGFRDNKGTYELTVYAWWWSTGNGSIGSSGVVGLNEVDDKVFRDEGVNNYGLSVRYIKNSKDQTSNTFTDSRDGKVYKIVKIGNQIWMAENLAYKASSGCWAYNDSVSGTPKYGYLYNYNAAMKSCPIGWHIPSESEWKALIDYCNGKLNSSTGWNCPNTFLSNSSGFIALPGGCRINLNGKTFNDYGMIGYWWSSSVYKPGLIYNVSIKCNSNAFLSYNGRKDFGLSVRCIKD